LHLAVAIGSEIDTEAVPVTVPCQMKGNAINWKRNTRKSATDNVHRLFAVFSNAETCVGATKTERVFQRHPPTVLPLPWFGAVRHVMQPGHIVRYVLQIDGGWKQTMPAGHHDEQRFQVAGRTEQMTMGSLCRRNRQRPCVLSEKCPYRTGFYRITDRRRCGVCINVPNVGNRYATIGKGSLHRQQRSRPILPRCRQMGRIARQSIPEYLAVDWCSSPQGMLQLFQHENGRPLAHHKAIATLVERSGRCRRFVVECRAERSQPTESGNPERTDASFRTATHHHVRIAVLNEAERIAYGMGTRSTGGRNGMVRSAKPVPDAELSGRHVGQDAGHKKWAHPVVSLLERFVRLANVH
uniref:Uncharacterized protein n=1 Tax=Anopheles coluzzii TaxID=1518534 RepID=A0A8W7PTP0_ANOCL